MVVDGPCWLRIDVDATVEAVTVPADGQYRRLRELLGGPTDRGIYHRRAIHYVQDGPQRTDANWNLAAWAAACLWRRTVLSYEIYGPVVVTGPDSDESEGLRGLDEDVARELRACADAVMRCRERWRRMPVMSQEHLREVLTEAQRGMETGPEGA
ncbi:hypothetical protein AN218_09360 [Streptomyces nanshensis]|uniref:Uncharacterized protein n=1 Tax=Streptomyces nanshensis TaxID=518642 RepID=A0A1E7L8C0_9ACTN|nr:hypothetical protein AN218_09360 [Streptomyces nanshensis]